MCHNCFPLLRVSNISIHIYECYLFIHFKFLSVTLRLLLDRQVFHSLFKFYSGNVLIHFPPSPPCSGSLKADLYQWHQLASLSSGCLLGSVHREAQQENDGKEECEGIYSLSLLPRVLISSLNIDQNSCQDRPLQVTFSLWFWYHSSACQASY